MVPTTLLEDPFRTSFDRNRRQISRVILTAAGFRARSVADRLAVRFFAAASEAFLARAACPCAVMLFAAILPPSLP